MIAIGLGIQAIAIFILFRCLGQAWSIHVGAIFVLLAGTYHGLNEILLWWFPDSDPYRRLISPEYVSQFVLWISVGILLFTLAYLRLLGRISPPRSQSETSTELIRIRKIIDWRLMLLLVLPLVSLTVAGNGYIVAPATANQALDLSNGLSVQFLLITIVFASFGIIIRFGKRCLLPVLLVQSVAVSFAGQRLEILVTAGLLLYALARVDIRIQRRQVALVLASSLMVVLVLTSARAVEGHISGSVSGSVRIDYLVAGLVSIGSPATRDQLAGDLGYRLDGNSFGALELQALDQGAPVLGATPLVNDLLLAVPSILNPGKTYSPIENRSEKEYAEVVLGLPVPNIAPGVREDILPTQLGATIGFWGPWGMLLAALVLGALFGVLDRWLVRRLSAARLLIGVALLSCVLFYERSWETYPIALRGVALLLPLVWILQSRRAYLSSQEGASRTPR